MSSKRCYLVDEFKLAEEAATKIDFFANKFISLDGNLFLGFKIPLCDLRILMVAGDPDQCEMMIPNLIDVGRDAVKSLLETNIANGQGTTHRFNDFEGRQVSFMFVNVHEIKSHVDYVVTGSHESLHLASHVLDYMGMTLSKETEEMLAYTKDFIFTMFIKYFSFAEEFEFEEDELA